MKWYTFLIAIALLFVQCGGDDDGPTSRYETVGTVNMKISGRSHSLDITRAGIRQEPNWGDPEQGVLYFKAVNCADELSMWFEMINEIGEHDIFENDGSIAFWYDQLECGYDRSRFNGGDKEYFVSGTTNLIEIGVSYKGTFSGEIKSAGGGRGHEITDGRFELTLSD